MDPPPKSLKRKKSSSSSKPDETTPLFDRVCSAQHTVLVSLLEFNGKVRELASAIEDLIEYLDAKPVEQG